MVRPKAELVRPDRASERVVGRVTPRLTPCRRGGTVPRPCAEDRPAGVAICEVDDPTQLAVGHRPKGVPSQVALPVTNRKSTVPPS